MKLTRPGMHMAAMLLCLPTLSALAQTQAAPPACSDDPAQEQTTQFVFHNVTEQSDMNELLTAARNIVSPRFTKLFLIPARNTVILRGCAQDLELAKKIFTDGDKPRTTYTLALTVTELDGNKRLTSHEYTVLAHDGERAQIKNGQKIPVITGSTDGKDARTSYQFIDVGTSFDLTPLSTGHGVYLRAKVESSSVAQSVDGKNANPTLQQAVSDFNAEVPLNKDTRVTSMDLPNGHRLEFSLRVTPM